MKTTVNVELFDQALRLVEKALKDEGLELTDKQLYQAATMAYELLLNDPSSKPSSYLISKIVQIVKKNISGKIQ